MHYTKNLLRIAAILLVVIVPVALWMRPGVAPSPVNGITNRQASVWVPQNLSDVSDEFVLLLHEDHRLSEDVWRTTGRGIAELPHQVRRAAALSDSTPLTGAFRPVAGAWQAFWRVLPGESVPVEPAAEKTGYWVADPERAWA